jgi:hypothetical protein
MTFLFHGSEKHLSRFKPLTHFGTEKAAMDRLQYKKTKGNIYKVIINIDNPAVIKDAPVKHTPSQFAFALKDAKLITHEEMLTVTTVENSPKRESKQTAILIKLLISKGYDGLVYKNRYEDKGHNSYVILKPEQVQISEKIKWKTN